mmetsp:Transcript_13744/g.18885  ORF Transcript_13744/g.18885 Transcript_13744/m.18885 type:complete len:84 (+) Transcript_13744:189-440(+)
MPLVWIAMETRQTPSAVRQAIMLLSPYTPSEAEKSTPAPDGPIWSAVTKPRWPPWKQRKQVPRMQGPVSDDEGAAGRAQARTE